MEADLTADKLYFDDFQPGQVRQFGHYLVTREEIIEFATRFDPQPFHVDEDAANKSWYGGLIASSAAQRVSSGSRPASQRVGPHSIP